MKTPSFSQKLTLIIASLGLLLAAGCGGQDRRIAVDHLNKGLGKLQEGQTMAAVTELKAAVDSDKSYAEPALYLGDIYHQKLQELPNAEQAYREALQRDNENVDTMYKLGSVLYDQEKYSEAASHFERVVAADQDYAKGWFRLGLSQQAQAQYPDAVDSYTKSIHANPRVKMGEGDPGGAAYHALGDLYSRFGLYDKALAVYKNGIQNNQDVARLYTGQGFAQQKLKRHDEAEQSLSRALEIEPNNVAATFNMAVVKHELGREDEAMQVLESYLDRAEDSGRREAAQSLLMTLRASQEESAEAAQ